MTEHLVQPHNIEAEESVLGAMLLSPRAAERAAEILKPESFYRPSHAHIFDAALGLMSVGEPIDGVTLVEKLEREGRLEIAGGKERIHELIGLVPAASNVQYHAEIVKHHSIVRGIANAGQLIAQLAFDGRESTEEMIAEAEQIMLEAMQDSSRQRATAITDGQEAQLEEIRQAYTSGEGIFGTATGFKGLDALLSGMWPDQLITIAARTGQGKSTLGMNIAENVADRNETALIMSLEMSKREMRGRSWARAAKIDGRKLQTGLLTQDEAKRLGEALPRIDGRREHLFVHDDGTATIPDLRAEATRLKRERGLSLIVVDYIQLVSAPGDTAYVRVSNVTRALKLLAYQLHVPIIAMSQMNRATDGRSDKRPVLSDLRDSGSIEQDSDVVIFLHDESNYDPDKQPDGEVKAIIAKNRRGPTADVDMLFTRRLTSFFDKPTGGTPNGNGTADQA